MRENLKSKTRRSSNRSAVYSLLSEREEALRHKDLFEILEGCCDRVTIYRALDRLIAERKVIRFLGSNGNTYFGLSANDLPEGSGYVYCLCRACDKVKRIKINIPAIAHTESFRHDITIHLAEGKCCSCNKPNS